MAVLTQHRKFYEDLFKIEGFLAGPFLMFGFQDISPDFNTDMQSKSFKRYLMHNNVKGITVLDYADERADIHVDMNYPFDQNTNKLINGFKVVCDIGCLEHVFNIAQCLENCLSMVEVGGLYVLHTPVSGYYKHGLHTFNPDMLRWVLKANGFEIEYEKYSTKDGMEVVQPPRGHLGDVIIWIAARRVEKHGPFVIPVQDRTKPLRKSVKGKKISIEQLAEIMEHTDVKCKTEFTSDGLAAGSRIENNPAETIYKD